MDAEITPVIVAKEVVSDDFYVVVELFFNDGESVQERKVIGTFETSKGIVDVEAPTTGYVFYNVNIDENVPVGTMFAAISPSPEFDKSYFKKAADKETTEAAPKRLAGIVDSGTRFSTDACALLTQHNLDASAFHGKPLVRAADVLAHSHSVKQNQEPANQAISTTEASQGNKIVIIGGGGHAKMCIDILRQTKNFQVIGIIDSALSKNSTTLGVPVLGGNETLKDLFKQGIRFATVGFGALDQPAKRQQAYLNLKKMDFLLPNLIHPTAIIEPSVTFGEGNQIMAGAIIGSDTKIGNNCIVNSGSIISHDCKLADNVHVTPGAMLAGTVHIGTNTVIGMGATILMNIQIGSNTVINNGVNVSKNIQADLVVKG